MQVSDSEGNLNPQLSYAGFWWRFLACLIDVIIIQVGIFLTSLVLFPVLQFMLALSGISHDVMGQITDFIGVMLCLQIGSYYYEYMESSVKQATLGKQICRLKVVSKEGKRLSWNKAAIRHSVRLLHSLIFALVGWLSTWLFLSVPASKCDPMLLTLADWFSIGLFGMLLPGMPLTLLSKIFLYNNMGVLAFSCIGIVSLIVIWAVSSVGYLPALWTPKKQTLHDLITGTVVVKKVKEIPSETVASVPLSQDP